MLTSHQGRSDRGYIGEKKTHKKFKADWFGGIYTDIPPVATPLADKQFLGKVFFLNIAIYRDLQQWTMLFLLFYL